MTRIATVIATLNEELHIERAIASARPLGPVFVIDSGSTDATVAIAQAGGAVVWKHPWEGYAAQKNWARERLPAEIAWVLHLDADETLTPILRSEIAAAIQRSSMNGFYLPRRNIFFGKDLKHAWWYPDYQLRLFRRDSGRYEEREVHEHVVLNGEAGFLSHPLIHENRKSVEEFVSRHMRYAALEAREMLGQPNPSHSRLERTGWLSGSWPDRRRALKVKVWYRLPARPLIRFLWMFVVSGGFRDGRRGFVYCQVLAAYEAMIDAKLLEGSVAVDPPVIQADGDLRELLRCPACGERLVWQNNQCHCTDGGHRYPIVDGIPVLLRSAVEGPRDDRATRHKRLQASFFDQGDGQPQFEAQRPHGTPRLYRWILQAKFARSVDRIEHLLPGATAVAVCGGSGMDAEQLAKAGAKIITADISLGASKRAAQRAERYRLPVLSIVADAEHMPLADAAVDIAYVHDGLHHLEDPRTALCEMARVSRRAVSVTEPATAAATALAIRLGLALEKEEAGNRVARLSVREVRTALEQAGLTVVKAKRYGLFYRHEPGFGVRLFSLPLLYGLARLTWTLAATWVGRFGNKLSVEAVRRQA
jgi:SAM-dependent methyltransferase